MTCCGDERSFTLLKSMSEDSLFDRIAEAVLHETALDFRRVGFIDRGSDERQYSAPGVDLPMVAIMRSAYDLFPEYHTSLDNTEFVTPAGLGGTYEIMRSCLFALEHNCRPKAETVCEPQLGRRGLYPNVNTKDLNISVRDIVNVFAYSNGKNDVLDISGKTGLPVATVVDLLGKLAREDLISLR